MNDVYASEAQATVWIKATDGPLHDGPAIEYIVTLANGQPQSYQRTLYEDGDVLDTHSSTETEAVPDYVRHEVEKHMIPKGSW